MLYPPNTVKGSTPFGGNNFKINKRLNIMKRISILLILFAMGTALFAAQISQQQAMEQARSFINKMKSGNRALKRAQLNVEILSALPDEQLIYAFNIEDGGFVIVSGDDRTLPVLGYSMTGSIDADDMPDNMRSWLKACELEIAAMKHSNVAATQTEDTSLPAIEPLLKTTWYQTAPYNLLTPIYNGEKEKLKGKHGATGCTATAMAQVMYYHQWPKEATQPIPEYSVENEFVEGLPATTFKWDKMLLNYDSINPGTEEEQLAVAELMNYCGRALKMEYNPDGSGTVGLFIANAVRRYFDYSKSTRVAFRRDYSIDGWRNLLWNELNNKRPVAFGGSTTQGGHSFVIDGYDGKGLFHVNWGWAGRSDGYFAIGILNPKNTTSTGASTVDEGYILDQSAIIGMEKSTGTEEVIPEVSDSLYLPEYLYLTDDKFGYSLKYYSFDNNKGYYYFGWGEKNADGTCTPFVESNTVTEVKNFKPLTPLFKIKDYTYKDGTYKIYPMAKLANKDDATWKIIGSENQYFNAVVKDSKLKLSIPYKLVITDAYFKNPDARPLDYDSLVVVVENQGDIDVSMLALARFYEVESASESSNSDSKAEIARRAYFSDPNFHPLSLHPGERETLRFYMEVPTKGDHDLCIVDVENATVYARKTMTIKNDFIKYDVEFTDYRLEYTEEGQFKVEGTLKNNDTRDLRYGDDEVIFAVTCTDDNGVSSEATYAKGLAVGSSVVLGYDFFSTFYEEVFDPEEQPVLVFTVALVHANGYGFKWKQNLFNITIKCGTVVTPEGVTAVEGIRTEDDDKNTPYYDLQGRKFNGKPTQKGVYINKGKKIIVK